MSVSLSIGIPPMSPYTGSILTASAQLLRLCRRLLPAALLGLALGAGANEADRSLALQALTTERELITAELAQVEKTIALLQGSTRPGVASGSTAVNQLNADAVALKQRLIELSQQEIDLLQAEMSAADATPVETAPPAIESKPIPTTPDYSEEAEAARVAQLQKLLRNYYVQEEHSRQFEPTAEELEQREAARLDADRLARIPFNAGKVRLSGAEGSTALAQISGRLSNPDIPESRRDTAPLCSIKTHLFGALIASERRSLVPVGKHHYVLRVQLQPGDTTVRIQGYRWQVNLPEDIHTQAYLITLYKPPGATPEFHIFSVDELLAEEGAHLPAWMPEKLGIASAG